MMNQRPESRRERRQRVTDTQPKKIEPVDLPGPLRWLTNPKVFVAMGVIFLVGMLVGLVPGLIGNTSVTDNSGLPQQANQAPDVPVEGTSQSGTPVPNSTASAIKRYDQAPPFVLDAAKRYTATIATSKGEIKLDLFPSDEPPAVNAFVFLARDGYYNGTPFMQVAANADGSRFTAQAGDPTRTGCGTPGFDIKEQSTSRPFVKGAVGYDSGQFFIAYTDQPALTGKTTIIGQVTAGLDVLDRLTLVDARNCAGRGSGDEIQSVSISES